jgi:hypothetical protein
MLQQALALALPVIGWWLLTGTINLAFCYKSQIEAYVVANPRRAAIMKALRSYGFDPWNALASLQLLVAKKLPDAQRAGSAVAKSEQRKADIKALGGPPDDGAGGTGDMRPPPPSVRPPGGMDAECRGGWRHPDWRLALVFAVLLTACNHDAPPCSAEDLARGPLALHNTSCAAKRQASFPNLPDETCDATPGCKAIVDECDRWAEERCK